MTQKLHILNDLFREAELLWDRIHYVKQFGNRFRTKHSNACRFEIGNTLEQGSGCQVTADV